MTQTTEISSCFIQIWNTAPVNNLATMGLRAQISVRDGTTVSAKRVTRDKTATKVSCLVSLPFLTSNSVARGSYSNDQIYANKQSVGRAVGWLVDHP